MHAGQKTFLLDQIFSLTLMGTAQRGRLYRKEADEPLREGFRRALRAELANLAIQYEKEEVLSEQHCTNIELLSNHLSNTHKEALNGGRFRIGSAQKALNLYLKYLWCLDLINQPPHCPFDHRVLSLIPNCETVKWTELDCLSEYKRIVGKAKNHLGNRALADWELEEWQRTQTATF